MPSAYKAPTTRAKWLSRWGVCMSMCVYGCDVCVCVCAGWRKMQPIDHRCEHTNKRARTTHWSERERERSANKYHLTPAAPNNRTSILYTIYFYFIQQYFTIAHPPSAQHSVMRIFQKNKNRKMRSMLPSFNLLIFFWRFVFFFGIYKEKYFLFL